MRTIYAKDYGILPDTKEDCTEKFIGMFENNMHDTKIILEKGRYDFYSVGAMHEKYSLSNTTVLDYRNISVQLKNMSNIELDCSSSEFVFHGQVLPFCIHSSSGITLKNFSIDWEIPLSAEGIIAAITEDYIDVRIDQSMYPCSVKDKWLFFHLEDGFSPLCEGCPIEFDYNTRTVSCQTGDNFTNGSVEYIGEDIFRIFGTYNTRPHEGNILVLRHNQRLHSGIFIENSKYVCLSDINIYSTGGLGVLAQFSENIHFKRIHFIPNRKKGRMVLSGHDDGLHLSNNRGVITVEECSFHGLMDDPINIHGTCAKIIDIPGKNAVKCRFMHDMSVDFKYWAEKGHEISFINHENMSSYGSRIITGYELINSEEFLIYTECDVPSDIQTGDAVENITNTAGLICRNSIFGSCRARGILISTPKPVIIQNNYFDSSGCAILVAGDANQWYESGECHDITIRNNIFSDACLTSMYQFTEAVISICPEIPKPEKALAFHKNIRIYENTFYTSDYPVLYALSANNLRFERNRIIRSYRQEPWHPSKYMFSLNCCSDVSIRENLLIGDTLGNNIKLVNMEQTDITRL